MATTANTVELRIVASGADQAARQLQGVAAAGAHVGTVTTSGASQASAALNGLSGSLKGVQGAAANVSTAMQTAGLNTGMLGQSLAALATPLGAVAVALGAVASAAIAGVRAMSTNADEVKRLVAVSGLSAEAADNLADTFQLLGKDSTALTNAMFKMGTEIDGGGKALAKLGVNLQDSSGALKSEGELFLEVRDRISEMGSASERSAALTQLFGRAGRELADVMSLSREEFRRVAEQAGAYSEWNETLQAQTVEYQRALAALGLQFDALAQTIGRTVIPPLTEFLRYLSEVIAKSKDPIDFVIRFTFGANPLTEISSAIRAQIDAVGEALFPTIRAKIRAQIKAEMDAAGEFARELARGESMSTMGATAQRTPFVPKVDDQAMKRAAAEAEKLAKQIRDIDEALREASTGFDAAVLEAGWQRVESGLEKAYQQAAEIDALLASIPADFDAAMLEAKWARVEAGMERAVAQAQAIDAALAAITDDFDAEVLEAGWRRQEAALDKAASRSEEYATSLAIIGAQAQILGRDFDATGARISILQGHLNALLSASRGEITPAIAELGATIRMELADQSLYQSIEQGFLSITDTFSKMATGLIQGTLDIADAFKNLGQSLLINFVNVVLHEVFDPILKAAASFVSDLLGMLLGRQSTGAAGGLLDAIVGAFSGAGGLGASTGGGTINPELLGAGATGTGGGFGMVADVGGYLATAYSAAAWALDKLGIAKLPSILDLVGKGLTYVGEAAGLITPAATAASAEFATLATSLGLAGTAAAAAGAAAVSMSGGVVGLTSAVGAFGPIATTTAEAIIVGGGAFGATAGGTVGSAATGAAASGGIAGGSLAVMGAGFVLGLPFILKMLQDFGVLGRSHADVLHERFQGARAAQGVLIDVNAALPDLTLQKAQTDASVRGNLALLGSFATFWRDTAKAELEAGMGGAGQEWRLALSNKFIEQLGELDIAADWKAAMDLGRENTGIGLLHGTVPFQDVGAWEKVLEAYSDVLAVLLASADVERRRAEEIERFNREVRPGLIADLLGDPVQIALLLDLPALAQEGEETADTMTRMVVALDGIGQAMDMLGVRAAQLRGDLDIPAQLVERLAEIDKAIDIANVAPVTTQDPAKMNAAIQDLITLEEQRLALILETTAALRSQMQAQAASLSSGFVALAQAAPVLNDLGIAVYNMTYALGDVINILGEVGDAAGQLATVGSQVAAFAAEISGADPAVILGSARALAAGLSATAASVNALEDAQQRMAGLTQLLGALTTGYQEATAALAAHFAELQAQEEALHASRIDALQSEVDAATRIVEAYYGSQRDALTALLATSRQFSESARRVRDQILGIQLAPTTSALNPADRLDVALTELGAAFAKFQATPTAELADRVGERVGQALTAAGEVFSRPSPAFAALSGDMISILETVAATAEARVVPEEASRILLASIDASETAALIELGAINSATAATEAYLKGTLTKENLDRLQDLGIISLAQKEIATALGSPLTVETGLKEILSGLGLSPETEQSLNAIAGVVAAGSSAAQAIKDLNTDHAAKLDAIAEAEAAWGAVLNLELANIAGQIVGTTAEVLDVATEVGVVNSTLWHISTQTNGIWGAANALLTELVTTRADLVRVIGTAPVDQFMRDRAKETADSLQNLRESIHGSLWLLVSGRLDAILDQGGPQAVADALKGPAEQTARNTSLIAANIYWMTHALRGGIGLEQVALPQAATGMWDVPRDQAVFVHRGEMIKPAAAAEWERRGGLSVQTASGSRTETERSVNITLNISGADDPRRVGDEVIRRLRRELGLYGKTL